MSVRMRPDSQFWGYHRDWLPVYDTIRNLPSALDVGFDDVRIGRWGWSESFRA